MMPPLIPLNVLVALYTVTSIALANLGSRNIGVATGALVGALILYLVSVPFELQRSVTKDHIKVLLQNCMEPDRSIKAISSQFTSGRGVTINRRCFKRM